MRGSADPTFDKQHGSAERYYGPTSRSNAFMSSVTSTA